MPIKLYTADNKELPAPTLVQFSGGERHVQIGKWDTRNITQVNIRANIWTAEDLMDLLLVGDAFYRHLPDAHFNIEIPYMPYSRQDRMCAVGQAFSLEVLAHVLNTLKGVNKLVTWDCHSAVGLSLLGAINVSPEEIINKCSPLIERLISANSVVICPDRGAVNRTANIVKFFETAWPVVIETLHCTKVRDPSTGQITGTAFDFNAANTFYHESMEKGTPDLTGKTCIITDDICDGGYTFIQIAKLLREHGANRVILYVTHGIFSKGLSVFEGLIDEVYTTASFPNVSAPMLTVIDYERKF
jgi:ribose-phosphate pyrophosphokinase